MRSLQDARQQKGGPLLLHTLLSEVQMLARICNWGALSLYILAFLSCFDQDAPASRMLQGCSGALGACGQYTAWLNARLGPLC